MRVMIYEIFLVAGISCYLSWVWLTSGTFLQLLWYTDLLSSGVFPWQLLKSSLCIVTLSLPKLSSWWSVLLVPKYTWTSKSSGRFVKKYSNEDTSLPSFPSTLTFSVQVECGDLFFTRILLGILRNPHLSKCTLIKWLGKNKYTGIYRFPQY